MKSTVIAILDPNVPVDELNIPIYPCRCCDKKQSSHVAKNNVPRFGHVCYDCYSKLPINLQKHYAKLLPRDVIACEAHGVSPWRGHVKCSNCCRVYQTAEEHEINYAPCFCECGCMLMPHEEIEDFSAVLICKTCHSQGFEAQEILRKAIAN